MDFKNNKLKKDLLKFTIETLSILITTKNKLKELYTTIDDESDIESQDSDKNFRVFTRTVEMVQGALQEND